LHHLITGLSLWNEPAHTKSGVVKNSTIFLSWDGFPLFAVPENEKFTTIPGLLTEFSHPSWNSAHEKGLSLSFFKNHFATAPWYQDILTWLPLTISFGYYLI